MGKTTKKESSSTKPKATRAAAAKSKGATPKPKSVTPKPKSVTAKKPARAAVTKADAEEGISAKAAPKKRAPRKAAQEPNARELIHASAMKAANYALEKKAVNVRLLDLKDITTMTDFFVIATGDSDRQVKAIAENVITEMRDSEGISPWRSEGWDGLQWVLVDFVDFVVHIFQTEARQYYNLERLWADAPSEEIKDEPVAQKRGRAKKETVELKPAEDPTSESDMEEGRELASGVRVISEFKEVRGK